jgi:ribosomal protein L35
MPKMKTNRMARKKFRSQSKGKKLHHGQAHTSHNTGKKSAKTSRKLRHSKIVDSTNTKQLRRQLPYLGKGL